MLKRRRVFCIAVLMLILAAMVAVSVPAKAHSATLHDCAPHIGAREAARGVDRESKCRYEGQMIRRHFGLAYHEAYEVADCEDSWSQGAGVGDHQYHGIFQMGEDERESYGHGWKVRRQVGAAYRYFAEAGYDWSPWSCKPIGAGGAASSCLLLPFSAVHEERCAA